MHRFWNTIISPVLEVLQPETIVQIGASEGTNTANLLDFCERHGATLHAIDPLPKFDVASYQQRHGERLVFHHALSLDAISAIDRFDAVLIDGDHNWYTVFNELKLIEKICVVSSQLFPLVMLHDIGWPYGRRDLYNNPENIPDAFRKPYRQMGMLPGSSELVEKGGLNPHLLNAVQENDLQSGVLTAVEDFLKESELALELVKLPGLHGLGLVISTLVKEQRSGLRRLFEDLELAPFAQRHTDLIEAVRIETEIVRQEKISVLKDDLKLQSQRLEHQAEVIKQQSQIVNKLVNWMDELDIGISALLTSGRWKLGNTIGELVRKAMLKPRVPMATDHLDKIIERFRAWEQRFRAVKSHVQREEVMVAPSGGGLSVEGVFSDACLYRRSRTGDIIVCVHNAPDDVRKCLDALERHTNFRQHRLILVDDGSEPETARIVINYVTRLSCAYIRNETAQGYTRAANLGIRASSGDFVVLLNSDTIVTPGWIERLIDCAYSKQDVACVGPLSNAASWQSIPELTDEHGKWRINELPENVDLASYAEAIANYSPRLYPEVPFINGFCYLITRQALNKVGLLDEVSYPYGYGEEDDFSMRALDAGFRNKIADDCYVYHAKSKSFTAERREQLVEKSKKAIAAKHDPQVVRSMVNKTRTSEVLLRARVSARLAGQTAGEMPIQRDFSSSPLTIGWFQPHLRTVGGIRRAIEMTNRLVAWGHSAMLITPTGEKTTWMPIAADVVSLSAVDDVEFDVLIASDPDTFEPFLATNARLKINYHLAAYMLYRKTKDKLKAYYGANGGILHVTNSQWTAEQAEQFANIQVEKVIPGGIDRNIFRPIN
ncbi:MAG: glycosyltransferase, partial [Deltaproteobacteria bacterium]|nr:glycosyltransferase [Deltaproteobacteria bacterium]